MIVAMVEKGSVERMHVEWFLKWDLRPAINEFPKPYLVLMMDNAKIYHGDLIE
ncbi:hypothetical protein CROQUDRAFT_707754 [Cronartium quercuum f. sp. fusiforme G11]|uniref:Tc1-like transposase DDE domain-containing protein n=1 Tax=Cronartium quercuum f. sp. fusiforme G11 TaxID=708437 RepID=A0A9P6NPT1_9BASI|nr:hypothetical protein CROQUDRAFT_707754 [Cronartium quercuum f. sp. fusiforme G11]